MKVTCTCNAVTVGGFVAAHYHDESQAGVIDVVMSGIEPSKSRANPPPSAPPEADIDTELRKLGIKGRRQYKGVKVLLNSALIKELMALAAKGKEVKSELHGSPVIFKAVPTMRIDERINQLKGKECETR